MPTRVYWMPRLAADSSMSLQAPSMLCHWRTFKETLWEGKTFRGILQSRNRETYNVVQRRWDICESLPWKVEGFSILSYFRNWVQEYGMLTEVRNDRLQVQYHTSRNPKQQLNLSRLRYWSPLESAVLYMILQNTVATWVEYSSFYKTIVSYCTVGVRSSMSMYLLLLYVYLTE